MAFNPRLPLLALTTLSLLLTLSALSTSSNLLQTFNNENESNPWLLPLWTNHFDLSPLKTQITTSTLIVVINIATLLCITLVRKPFLTLITTILSTLLALVTVAFPSTVNVRSGIPNPAKDGRLDTLQTWTCRWTDTTISQGQGPPEMFARLCTQSRYSLYSAIPILVLQLILLSLAIIGLRNLKRGTAMHGQAMLADTEKGNGVVFGERPVGSSAGQSVESKGSIRT